MKVSIETQKTSVQNRSECSAPPIGQANSIRLDSEDLEYLKTCSEDLTNTNNELKMKVVSLKGDVSERNTTIKALTLKVQRTKEAVQNIHAENESLRSSREEIISVQMIRSKRAAKGAIKLSESVLERYISVALQVDKMIPECCSREVAGMQFICENRVVSRGGEVKLSRSKVW